LVDSASLSTAIKVSIPFHSFHLVANQQCFFLLTSLFLLGFQLRTIEKLMAGIIQVGGWGIFEGLLKVDVGTLSVLAQLLRQAFSAVSEHSEKLLFDGKQSTHLHSILWCIWLILSFVVRIDESYAFFMVNDTLSVSVPPASKMPDNLKQFFRPVYLWAPSEQELLMICEVSLLAKGFREARSLAAKIVFVYNMLSKQLFQSRNLQFGLRAMQIMLSTAAHYRNHLVAVATSSSTTLSSQEELGMFRSQALLDLRYSHSLLTPQALLLVLFTIAVFHSLLAKKPPSSIN
jgi:dynein heavy chain